MWLCSKCQHKNNNSSKACHGHNCNGIREEVAFEIPVSQLPSKKKEKRILDYCPSCKKDMFFTPTRWEGKSGYWRCESHSHRPCELIGRSKPISSYLPKVNV